MMTFMRQSLSTVVNALRKEIGWIILNLVGMLAPILFEWWLEIPRSGPDTINGIDVIYTWVTEVFPFLVVIFIVNVVWLAQIWRRNRPPARRRAFGTWLLVCGFSLIPLCLNSVAFRMLWLISAIIDGRAFRH